MSAEPTPQIEFCRPLRLSEILPEGLEREVRASPAECDALALRMHVPAIAALSCRWRLAEEEAGRIRAEGDLEVALTRECVVSLEPFETSQRIQFAVRFVPAGTESDEDPDSIDELPYSDGVIDLGEAASEQLGLDLDPYPRQPGAVAPAAAKGGVGGPFAALAGRRGDGGQG
jgi:hypothetical protein